MKSNIILTLSQANPKWFRDQVRNHGPWDYKQSGFEAFGNFNYGATGAAFGFPTWFLLKQAGAAQVEAGTSRPEFGSPGVPWLPWTGTGTNGDDPADQEWILRGIEYFKYLVENSGGAEDECSCSE